MSEPALQILDSAAAGAHSSLRSRLKVAWELEFGNLRWRLLACALLARLLPANRAIALRTRIVRAIGLDIGPGTHMFGMPKITSSPGPLRQRLRIGADCTLGSRVILECGDVLAIGDRVTLADGVVILTTSHQIGPREHRAGALVRSPVVIGDDVHIGADSIILPGATLGNGARVLPKSVVNAAVAPGATVAGIPARLQRAT